MCAFIHDIFFDTGKTVEDDSASATLDVVDGSVREGESNRGGDGKAVNLVEHVDCHREEIQDLMEGRYEDVLTAKRDGVVFLMIIHKREARAS